MPQKHFSSSKTEKAGLIISCFAPWWLQNAAWRPCMSWPSGTPKGFAAILKGRAGGAHCLGKAPAVPDKPWCRGGEGELAAVLQLGGSPGRCAILLAQRAPSLPAADKTETQNWAASKFGLTLGPVSQRVQPSSWNWLFPAMGRMITGIWLPEIHIHTLGPVPPSRPAQAGCVTHCQQVRERLRGPGGLRRSGGHCGM